MLSIVLQLSGGPKAFRVIIKLKTFFEGSDLFQFLAPSKGKDLSFFTEINVSKGERFTQFWKGADEILGGLKTI